MLCARVFSCPFVSFAGFLFLSPREFSPCPRLARPGHGCERRAALLVWFGLDPLKAHWEHTLPPEGFCFRDRLGTFERLATSLGGLPKWDGPTRLAGEFGENSLHLYRGVFSAKSVQLFHNFLDFFVGAQVGVVRGRLLTNAGKVFAEQAAVDAIARRAVRNVLADGFIRVDGVFRVAFKRFEGRTSDSRGVGEIVQEVLLHIPE